MPGRGRPPGGRAGGDWLAGVGCLGYSPVGLPSLIDRADLGSNGIRAVIEAAAEVVKRGYHRDAEATARQHRDPPREWAACQILL